MRRLILILALLLAPAWGTAQEAETPDRAIQGVIQSQLTAFSRGNVVGAWAHASPTIQDIFDTPEYFGIMVERGFPMVWQPGEVAFRQLGLRNGRPVQRVELLDQQGRLHLLDYEMVLIDGIWRISAVEILRAPSLGV